MMEKTSYLDILRNKRQLKDVFRDVERPTEQGKCLFSHPTFLRWVTTLARKYIAFVTRAILVHVIRNLI